ncbi:MAG: R3H domain-containing nucleic acid-binding protein [bacterium]|nr:hypothetical protein [Myxococcales bacterium]
MSETNAAAAAQSFLTELFDRMSIAVRVTRSKLRGDQVVVELDGDDADRLEARPELVSALTLLTGQVAGRASGERVRMLLDIGGAFDARKELLEAAADDIARIVERTGRRAVLDGLNSSERRVVHNRLSEDDSVKTRSEGEEGDRRLLVERA